MSSNLPFGPIGKTEWVSVHCMRRAIERIMGKSTTVGQTLAKLEEMLEGSLEADLKPEKKVNKILNHGGRLAKYRVYLGSRPRLNLKEIPEDAWIMVLHDDNTLATIHQNNSQEWVFKDEE